MMSGKNCTISVLEKNNENVKKRVTFDPLVRIQNTHVWAFAYQSARESEWMRFAADRYRFELRKQKLESLLAEIGFFSRKNI